MSTGEFESLVREHARLMSSAIRKVCGHRHRELVPDVEQEVYLALWKRLEGGGEKIRFPGSYVYKVALTTALSVIRKMGLADDPIDEASHVAPRPNVGKLEPAERMTLLREALSTLERDESRALRAYLAGFNHREVAKLFGWTESVARHRIYRGIETLSKAGN